MASADMTVHIADAAPVRDVLDAVIALVEALDEAGDPRYVSHLNRIHAALVAVPTRKERSPDALREALAALSHFQWCEWAAHLMQTESLSRPRLARWNRLVVTPYDDLTEDEKTPAREWADRVLALLSGYLERRKDGE